MGSEVTSKSTATKGSSFCNIEALAFTNTILRVPYYTYNIVGPKTLVQLFRLLYYRFITAPAVVRQRRNALLRAISKSWFVRTTMLTCLKP